MTNLDLPQISISRYVDLLKRRKWTVLPVSLLGMLVGALIAVAMPRYYEAWTEVRFNAEAMLTDRDRQLTDPLEELLAQANHLIPARVPEVLDSLDWPEAHSDDEDARADFVAEVTRRVSVADVGTGSRRDRANTILRISYRDTDGHRAAEFTNALRDAWIKAQKDKVESDNREVRREVQERKAGIEELVESLAREVATWEQKNKLDPSMRADSKLQGAPTLEAARLEDRRLLALAESERDELEVELDALRQTLDGGMIEPRIPAPPPPIDPLLGQELLVLQARIAHLKRTKDYYQPGTQQRTLYEQQLAKAQEELVAKTPVPATKTIPNPDYRQQEERRDALLTRRTALRTRIAALEERIEQTERELRERPGILQEYNERVSRYQAARTRLSAVETELDQVTALARRIEASRPYSTLGDAQVPRRPSTNVTLLALMGSLVGLGVAVGLILAFDALRFTYKTLDDLERGLPVPVLGGVSHVETVEEHSQVRRGRWLVSLLAVTLLFLIVAVATFYYVAPARLPTWARDLLDMVLGGTE
ncbi:MAG: hypothetical protein R3F56_18415 [Planctomycetota bacterium]